MTDQPVLCSGTRRDGSPCTRHRKPGGDTCKWHSPESIEQRAAALEAQAAEIRATAGVRAS